MADYETAIREAQSQGVMGGGIYDSLQAAFARQKKAAPIVTLNPSHFQHVAPDMEILTPYQSTNFQRSEAESLSK